MLIDWSFLDVEIILVELRDCRVGFCLVGFVESNEIKQESF